MKFSIAFVLAMVGCSRQTSSGDTTPPNFGYRYSCSVEKTCTSVPTETIPSHPCMTDAGDAEVWAIADAGCTLCDCFVNCFRESPPKICLIFKDLNDAGVDSASVD